MTHKIIFNGATQDWIKDKELSNICYTGHVLNGFDEALVGDSYVYVQSKAESTQTIAILIPNADKEETIQILNNYLEIKMNTQELKIGTENHLSHEAQIQDFIASNKQAAFEDVDKLILEYKELEKFGEKPITEKEKKHMIGKDIFYKMPMSMRIFLIRKFRPAKEGVNKHVIKLQEKKLYKEVFNFIEQATR